MSDINYDRSCKFYAPRHRRLGKQELLRLAAQAVGVSIRLSEKRDM